MVRIIKNTLFLLLWPASVLSQVPHIGMWATPDGRGLGDWARCIGIQNWSRRALALTVTF